MANIYHQGLRPPLEYPAAANPIAVLAGTVGVVATILAVVTIALEDGFPVPLVYGALASGVVVSVVSARRVRGRHPELVIDSEGIIVRRYDRIRWREIDIVRIRRVEVRDRLVQKLRAWRGLEIVLVSPEAVSARAPRRLRLHEFLTTTYGWSFVSISETQVLPHTVEDVALAMKDYFPALRIEF
ncbi:hypothetical protein [Nocardia rhizosphaerae]|uniref:PH domain-containing protein n=1 Tax=Nocardia rhizosphaerae TaxID=1691571 RepID=A0ABV8LCZ6_9NOCA